MEKATSIKQSDTTLIDWEREYEKIMDCKLPGSFLPKQEWEKAGDTFKQYSTYDYNYIPVPSLDGSTILISSLPTT